MFGQNEDNTPRGAFDPSEQRMRKRKAVLRAAAPAFNAKGFANTSMDDVASILGISKPTLYQYFKSKQEILYECHLLAVQHGEAGVARAKALEGSGLDKLMAYVERFMTGFFDDLGAYAVLLDVNSLAKKQQEEIISRRAGVSDAVETIVAAGVRDGSIVDCNPKLASLFVFGVVNWMSVWYRPGGESSPAEITTVFQRLFRSGLGRNPDLSKV